MDLSLLSSANLLINLAIVVLLVRNENRFTHLETTLQLILPEIERLKRAAL